MNFLEHKYITLISPRFSNFKKVGSDSYNFRCPFCGDSSKNKKKARGYIYSKKNRTSFFCHNCGHPASFGNFLKELDLNLYYSYVKDKMVLDSSWKVIEPEVESKKIDTEYGLSDLKTIEELSVKHPARKYVSSRKIPKEYYSYLRYTPKFKKWTNKYISKFDSLDMDEPRLIFPLIDKEGLLGWSGRSFDPNNKAKYINIVLDSGRKKIFGLDRCNIREKNYVVEGPVDSLFLPNCIAALTSSLHTIANSNSILISDNQPRNREIVRITKKNIDLGYDVVIWPASWKHKDINDGIVAGLAKEEIALVISNNTYNGNRAILEWQEWKKI